MNTYTLEHNTGTFQVTEEITINLDGQEMLNMGWEISEDSPESEYELLITDGKIQASILATNNEWSGSGFTFDYIDTIQDLIRNGYLMIVDENGDEAENGVLAIKP